MLAPAAELVLPSAALERDGPITAVLRTTPQATGKGTLAIRWTDILGRVVEERTMPVEMTDETEIRFSLDIRRAVAMSNKSGFICSSTACARTARRPPGRDCRRGVRGETARPPMAGLMIMMWQPHTAEQFATLRSLGVNGGQFSGRAKSPPDFLPKNNLRWYAENIATDFYAEYHRYRPDRIQNWSFLQAKELYRRDPSSKEAFKRHPSLSDPEWIRTIRERLMEAVRTQSPYRPVFYGSRRRIGGRRSCRLLGFRFLGSVFGRNAGVAERALRFACGVEPAVGNRIPVLGCRCSETTREAMKRTDENYSSWSDHKEWMDVSFSRALRIGVDAVRSVDPDAYAGIAGGQMPGWGGYDYWRLSHALTAIEPYDIGNNIEMLRSFQPHLPFVTTAFARGGWEKHRIWYELLHGARGNIIWDEKREMAPEGGKPAARGEEVAPYYTEITSGIGALLIQSTRQSDPVAIHYSQPSMRVEWEARSRGYRATRGSGEATSTRDGWTAISSACVSLTASSSRTSGLQYRFVSYEQVETGELLSRGYRVLILPRSTALSPAEVREIRTFAERGGVVVEDGEPGSFDQHGRKMNTSALAVVPMTRWNALTYHQDRLTGKEEPLHRDAAALFARAGVKPRFLVSGSESRPSVSRRTFSKRRGDHRRPADQPGAAGRRAWTPFVQVERAVRAKAEAARRPAV